MSEPAGDGRSGRRTARPTAVAGYTGVGAGALLREWRQRRRLSQLDLALEAEVSTRHLSFVETGRAQPSRALLLRLAERLAVPLRERNALLLAAGYAPLYPERDLAEPALAAVRSALRALLAGHEPYPAVVLDRHWQIVEANASIAPLIAGVAPALLTPPINVLRLSLHPEGLAPRIANLGEWRAHLLGRLRRQIDLTGDATGECLYAELNAYPGGRIGPEPAAPGAGAVAVPLRLRHGAGELALLSLVASFGTPLDITVAELMIESFFPADAATAAALHRLRS